MVAGQWIGREGRAPGFKEAAAALELPLKNPSQQQEIELELLKEVMLERFGSAMDFPGNAHEKLADFHIGLAPGKDYNEKVENAKKMAADREQEFFVILNVIGFPEQELDSRVR